MKNRWSKRLPALACVAGLGIMPACTVMREVALIPQSHFVPPNSNVEAIGAVVGEATGGGFNADYSAELVERAYLNALSQKNGDVLIDARLSRNSKLILFFYSTTVRVEGTAARIVAGRQRLSDLQNDQVKELARTGVLGEAAQK